MKTEIHPTAVVSPEAFIGEGAEIGPYSVIGPQAHIGAGTILMAYVHIMGDTQIGRNCRLFPGVSLGAPAQVNKQLQVRSKIEIGDENVFREYVTVNQSMTDGGKTVIGDRNFLMTGSHVGHDCILGNDIVMANSAALGGHVQVDDRAVIGGLAGVHQRCHVGTLTMIGACSKIAMDALPFSVYNGFPAKFYGVNAVGLKRAGFAPQRRLDIKRILGVLLDSRRNFAEAMPELRQKFPGNADLETISSFIARSTRGISRTSSDVE